MNGINLQGAANLVSSVVNLAIVRPLGDPYIIGISGLVFDIMDTVDAVIDCDITDHYVEANYAIQDHIALKPIIITMKGYAAEKVSVYQPNPLSPIFTAIVGLIPLAGLAPTYNTQDTEFYANMNNVAQLGINVVNSALSAFQIFKQASTMVTRQQSIFNFLLGMRNSRQLCAVETPFAVFENMAIQSIRPAQSGDTTLISEFIVTFKQILTVDSITGIANPNSLNSQNSGSTSVVPPVAGGSFQNIIADPVNLGNDSGTTNDAQGNPFTVPSVSKNIYTQQAKPY